MYLIFTFDFGIKYDIDKCFCESDMLYVVHKCALFS